VVDDRPDLLSSFKDYLEPEGYRVLTAQSEEQALWYCQEEIVHVALIDVRLDDHDEENYDGLRLAAALDDSISKIVITGQRFADPGGLIRRTLAPNDQGVVLAANFIWKSEGPKKILEAIRLAFRKDIKINPYLKTNLPKKEISWRMLVDQIKIFRDRDHVAKQEAEEVLQDLICRLFYKASEVKFWRTIPGHSHCTVALVQQVVNNVPGTDLAVKFGPRNSIDREEKNYRKYVESYVERRADLELGPVWSREMGAVAYSFVGEEAPSVRTFLDYYNDELISIEQIQCTLDYLFQKSCKKWYSGKDHVPEEIELKPLDISYRTDLNLLDGQHVAELRNQFGYLHLQRPVGNFSIRLLNDGILQVQIAERPAFKLPNPIRFAFEEHNSDAGCDFFPLPSQVAITHGDLHSGNIIVSDAGHTWLIDFYKTGWGHILRDFAELESDIKFTLLQTDTLSDRYELERVMVEKPQLLSETFDVNFKPSPAQTRALETIRHLRKLAYRLTETDGVREYFIALLFFALKRIVGFTSANTDEQAGTMARYHALLSAAMVCERLQRDARAAKRTFGSYASLPGKR
jgi:CheY-like chemotaxis protein